MINEQKAKARIILNRLNDSDSSFFFYLMAVRKLGFDKCYELASQAILAFRDGHIRTSLVRYYNGCVMKEINEKKQNYAKQ